MVGHSHGAITPQGGEFPLVGDIAGHQQHPSVALHREGGLVAWQNATVDSGGERVVVQALGADYRGVGVPQVVSQNITGQNDLNPAVAALPEGRSVVVWESGPRSSQDIFIRFLDAQGQFQTDIQPVNSFQAGVQSDAAVSALANGNVLVVWASDGQDGSGEGIYGQRFSQTGSKVGTEFRVSQTTNQNQSRPAVAALSVSQFVVAWVGESVAGQNSSGAPNLRRNVLARFIGVSDTAGNEFQLNEGDVVATEVSLTALPAGGFVAAWTQRDEVSSRNITEVFSRQYASNGLPNGEAQRVNTFLPGAQDSPVLAAVNAGVMMAWSSFGQDAGGLGVRGRLLSGGTEFGVNAQENFDQATPALASDGGQQILAVWANTIRADHSILSAQRYVLHDGSSLPAATDLSAGEVEVVGDEPVQRQTNPSVVAERERAAALKAQQAQNIAGTATLQVAAAPQPVDEPTTSPPPPTVETVAPAPVRVPVPPTPQVVEAVPPPQPQPADSAPQATSVAATPRAQSSVPTPALPSASTAALNALGGLTQRYQAGGQARQHLGSTRSYIAPVRQYASAESSVGTSPTRSSMLLGSTFSRTRPSALRITAAGSDIRLGQPRTAANSQSAASQTASGSQASQIAAANTAQARAEAVQANAIASAATANNTSQQAVPAGIVRTGRGTNLRWVSQYGARYQVQSSNDRYSWNNIGTPRTSTSGVDALNISNVSARYFRVIRVN
ncbi:MAG TPA: hypothetical protein DEQ62_07880 [Verrucomicrobiales bacterium]|nr:hypothetical protein [Verrucomicrobiales bacterium]